MILEMKVPAVGESITEVTLSAWLVKDGDYVKMDQPLCELESDKATMELPAEKAGVVKIIVKAGTDISIGDVVCTIDTTAEATNNAPIEEKTTPPATPEKPIANTPTEAPKQENYAQNHPSPTAQKLMRENDVKTTDVQATGKDGRITQADVQNALAKEKTSPTTETSAENISLPTSNNAQRTQRREKMSRLRRTVANHLVAAKNQTAMLTTFNEVDLTEIMNIRAKYKETFKEKHAVGLGFMSFFTKACSMALLEFEAVNAQIDGEEIIYNNFVDISVAVSTPRGLVTPIIRNTHLLSLKEIELAVVDLAKRGRDNKLTLEDMDGGTFTISNGGVFGSLLSTPIINAPQTAILGMHKIQDRPMAINGEIKIRPMMYLALSYDHRLIDGKEAVTFLVRVKDLLEDPIRLMLDV
ncbi:MAG: 2-oxoglutarate dehydrogenase complex dihydrolipoyllysine-residue succinyltransferase [Chitinophagales bacterium]|nr:2-oxoglutarate dehydrogenase complex dihydrolipoyllysine-residue succinyltransferase [Bacteroidota bacterium]MCB9043498.1 2-oxoglutarate dehydrogenase complex dihydrolipoyllysine-residue succinyltransferase [Chitinophagales bacterium]